MAVRVVLIGAGSREFGPATLRDLFLSDALCDAGLEVVLLDLNAAEVERTREYGERLARHLGRDVHLEAGVDLDAALPGAHFVVVAIEVGRYHYWAQDFHVPRDHGFAQIYGENGGPGGLFHALRNMGPSVRIARSMERHCPDAWLLNFTNPLTKLCEAQTRLTDARVIGLCHGIIHGREQVCRFLEMPVDRLESRASGLNHITWFQTLRDRETGEDLYPRLRAREREAAWLHDWDDLALSRILLRTFGLYPSPGANHIGEYIGWAGDFLASDALQFFYDPREGHPWDTGRVPTWIYHLGDHPTDVPLYPKGPLARVRPSREEREGQTEERILPSGEETVPILEALALGVESRLDAVNVPNRGWVPGLPEGAVVEVPARVDGDGLHPVAMPTLPEPILAVLRTQTSINHLLVEAFRTGSREPLLQAVLLDPSARSYRSAVRLVDRMCALQEDVLPPLR